MYESTKKQATTAIKSGAKTTSEIKSSMVKEQEDAKKQKVEKIKTEAAIKNAKKTKEQDLVGAKDSYKLQHAEAKKEQDYTPVAQKRKQQISESVAAKATPTASAKAVSSEAEKYVPAAQKRTQATSDQIYENVLKGEAYLQSEGDGLAKGIINRFRSVPGETIENAAYFIKDRLEPQNGFEEWLVNNADRVVQNNVAGQVGDIADEQIWKAKENTGNVGDFLIDTADALTQTGSNAVFFGPGNIAFSQGIGAGLEEYRTQREAGADKGEALFRGVATGAAGVVLERLGGIGAAKNSILKSVIPGTNKLSTQATTSLIGNIAKNALEEGGEEFAESAVNTISDVIADMVFKGEVTIDFDLIEALRGAAIGSLIGGGFGTVNYSPSAEPAVAPAEAPITEAENVTPEVTNEQEGAFAKAGNSNTDKVVAKGIFDKKIGTSGNLATQEDINNYVDYSFEYSNKAKQDPEHLPEKQIGQIKYGKTNDRLVNDVESIYGVDVDGYYHTLVDNDIRHIKNSHGEGTNEKYPITAEDIKQIPDIVNNYDNVYVVTKENGSQGIYYEKRHNGTTYYLEAIKEGNTLANKQMIKVGTGDIPDIAGLKEEIKKRRTPPAPSGDKPLGYTSETAWEDRSSNNKIAQDNDVVKNENTDAQKNLGAQNGAQGDGGFGVNTVGAAQSNPTSYAHLQNEHGVFEPGEEPMGRDANVPKKDAQGNRVSQGARNFMEAKVTPDKLIPAFEKEVAAGTFENKGKSNKEAVEKATKRLEGKTYGEAVNEFRTLYSDDKLLSKDDVVFGEILYSMAAQNGETDTAIELASLLVSNSSRTGDALQSQRILKRLSPEGRLYHAQKITEKFNKDKNQKKKIELSEETIRKVFNAKTEEEIQAANDAVAEDIAKQIDKGVWNDLASMWNAWRYFSMLGNPKTHIRNMFGNFAFLPARKLKNLVKAGIEDVAYKANWIDEKTASVKLASKENRDFAKESFKKNKKALLGGGNYRFESEVESKIEPFRLSGEETETKKFFNAVLTPARKLVKGNSTLLEAEDVLFLKNAYIDSLTQYLTANNLDANNLTEAQRTSAENYAAKEARKATYRDTSAIANALEKLSNTEIKYKGVKIKLRPFVDAVVPFRKTPINVLARAVEYSPVGLATTLALDGKAVKNGDITANEMIDHISSGLTGSGIYALGIVLALKGVLTGSEDEDKNEKEFAKLQGEQAYALKIGDGSYTLDWLAPTAIPLFLGAETVRVLKKEYGEDKKWGEVAWGIIKNLDKIANPMLEMSMLQNLDSFLGSNYGSEGNAISGLAQDLLASYVLQAVPSLLSQVAQTVDGTRRNAYYVDKTDKIPDEWQIPLQRAMQKIPGLSQKLPEYVDAWGRTQEQSDNLGVRVLENFLSPGYYKKKTVTEADEVLKQLYAETGESVFPTSFPKNFTVNKVDKNLSSKEYVEASKAAGKTKYDMLSQLVKNGEFKNLPAEQQVKVVKDVYSFGNVKGKQEVSDYVPTEKWYSNLEKAKEEGASPESFLLAKNFKSNIVTEEGGKSADLQMYDYLIADKKTDAKQDLVLLETAGGVDMSKYKESSSDPENILSAYNLIKKEKEIGGDGTQQRIIKQLIANKNTTAKENMAFIENVLDADMSNYKEATKNDKEALDFYMAKADSSVNKEGDIAAFVKKGYSAEEALAKYNVGSGSKTYEGGKFKGFSEKQLAKANKVKAKGHSSAMVAKAASAVTSLGNYGTKKSYTSYVKALEAVGITDKKFQQDFWNIYM